MKSVFFTLLVICVAFSAAVGQINMPKSCKTDASLKESCDLVSGLIQAWQSGNVEGILSKYEKDAHFKVLRVNKDRLYVSETVSHAKRGTAL